MRWLICFMVLLCSHKIMGQQLFLAAGQSNAVGMADSALSVRCEEGTAFEYKFDTLVALKDPVGDTLLHFEQAHTGSAWPAFAKAYHDLTGQQVVMIPAARGGSSCHYKAELSNYGTWDRRGRLSLVDNALTKARAAMRKTGRSVAGVIWSQGERDANAINAQQLTVEEYEQQLVILIGQFREVLGEQLPFYIIQTGYYQDHPKAGFDAVRAAQEHVAKTLKNVFVYSFEQQGRMKDAIHYNQTALNHIGTTVAKQVVLQEKRSL